MKLSTLTQQMATDPAAARASLMTDASGDDVGTYNGGSTTDGEDYASGDDPDSVAGPDDIVDPDSPAADGEDSGDEGETSGEESEAGEETEEPAPTVAAPAGKLEVDITDDKGRRKIEVDLGDTDKLKRIVQRAAGAQKLAAELKTLREQAASSKDDAEIGRALSEAWSKDQIEGVVRVLTGGKQTWQQLIDEHVKLEAWKKSATPDQLAAFDAKREAETARAEAERVRQQLDGDRKKSEEAREAAERAQLQGAMDSGLEKFGFSGKLGDAAREHRLNRQMWAAVRDELAEMPDDVVVDQALVTRLWREQAAAVRATVEAETRKETKKIVKQKSSEAKSAAQTEFRQASKTPQQELIKKMETGGFKSAIRAALRAGAR